MDPEFTVLVADSDPGYLERTCELISGEGHRTSGAPNIADALRFLAERTPQVVVLELQLLQSDRADRLSELRKHSPAAPLIITGNGPPGEGVRALRRTHEIYGYHDKQAGSEGLVLWVNGAVTTARHIQMTRKTRQGLRYVLEAIPHLHKVQSLDDVLEGILWQIEGLVGGESSFLAARRSSAEREPDVAGFIAFPQSSDEYVVRAATGRYRCGVPLHELDSVSTELVSRALKDRRFIVDGRCNVFPLALGEEVLGIVYLDCPAAGGRDLQLLEIFASQAASAIQKARLYELATVDSTTRVFLKSFVLERLAQTLKLASRQSFPVAVFMVDIDRFKKLNDEHGHLIGDRALRYLGHVLKRSLRDSDVVGRFGGDEFLVVLVNSDSDGAAEVGRRIHELLAGAQEPLPDGVPPFTVSVGLASIELGNGSAKDLVIPNCESVTDAIVAEADAAMYRAKSSGKPLVAAKPLNWFDFSD